MEGEICQMCSREEYFDIKKNGKLIAFCSGWQYFLYGDWVYALPTSGRPEHAAVWCAVSELSAHLPRLQAVLGHKWEQRPDIVVLHPELLPEY